MTREFMRLKGQYNALKQKNEQLERIIEGKDAIIDGLREELSEQLFHLWRREQGLPDTPKIREQWESSRVWLAAGPPHAAPTPRTAA
jgi:hypothetical protein